MIAGLTNVEKSAAFLISIGQEAAVEILKNLDEKLVIRLTTEMAHIESLSPEEREDIIGEFMIEFNRAKGCSYGGETFVHKALVGSVGEKRANEICSKIKVVAPKDSFAFLKEVDPEIICNLIQNEHPATIAIVFSHIDAVKAGAVLQLLSPDTAKVVAIRVAKMKKVSPEAVAQVAETIQKQYSELISTQGHYNQPGGIDKLADIMNHLDERTESEIMTHFESEMPDAAREIAERIYTFESVLDLTNIEVRMVIDRIATDELLVFALKGAGDELRMKLLRNVSNNRATDILNEMERIGAVPMSDITKARREIVGIMRVLDEAGSIVIKKGREKYVE